MAVAALTDLGVPLGGEHGIEVIGLAKERELEAGSAPDRIYRRNVEGLDRAAPELARALRARADPRRGAPVREHVPPRSPQQADPALRARRRSPASARRGASACSSTSAACARSGRRRVDELAKAPGMNRKAAEAVATTSRTVAGAGGRGDRATRRDDLRRRRIRRRRARRPAPRSGSAAARADSATIAPPCRRTMLWIIARPRPVPSPAASS